MQRRKIQLIAGTTYTISLPKGWVTKNKLKEQDEVIVQEKDDMTLIVRSGTVPRSKINSISLNVEEYQDNIDQVLFAVYNLGVEDIKLFSKKDMSKDVKSRIRKVLPYMSGTEITYEDNRKISVKVLLDKSKVEINQVLYRISLIINLSMNNILEGVSLQEMSVNEGEIDRLYHLLTKIYSVSLVDSGILNSSGINNVSMIPSYFMINKKLESVGDKVYALAKHASKGKEISGIGKEIIKELRDELSRAVKYLVGNSKGLFKRMDENSSAKIIRRINKIKDNTEAEILDDIMDRIMDAELEIANIGFYRQMINQKTL